MEYATHQFRLIIEEPDFCPPLHEMVNGRFGGWVPLDKLGVADFTIPQRWERFYEHLSKNTIRFEGMSEGPSLLFLCFFYT